MQQEVLSIPASCCQSKLQQRQRTLELAAVLLAAAVCRVPAPQDALHIGLTGVKLCSRVQ